MEIATNLISLRQLAKELGVSQPFLSQVRTGKRPIPKGLREKAQAIGAYHLLITDKRSEDRHLLWRTAEPDTASIGGGVVELRVPKQELSL